MESCSIRRLCRLSGYSASTLNRIKDHCLKQTPRERTDYTRIQYVVYDATYFHKDGCLLNLMDATNQKIVAHLYVKKESFVETYPWFASLRQQGLCPRFVTTDGERSVLRAIHMVWPQTKVQRCLYHLQHEGMRWLRTHPRTDAGKELRAMLSRLSCINTVEQKYSFIDEYKAWVTQHKDLVLSLRRASIAGKDLRRTMVLIGAALPDMFYYLDDDHVHATTNALEGFHSRLKADYRRHRGLSREHRIQYINWYCFFENQG